MLHTASSLARAHRARLAVALVAVAVMAPFAVAATDARALTVSSAEVGDRTSKGLAVRIDAAPGERNDITVLRPAGDDETWRVHDASAALATPTPPHCRAIDAHTIDCDGHGLEVSLGDGDDVLRPEGPWGAWVTVFDGDGDDVVRFDTPNPESRARTVSFRAGAGDDELVGSDGADVFVPGPGHDRVDGVNRDATARFGSPLNPLDELRADDDSRWRVDLGARRAVRGDDRTQVDNVHAVRLHHGSIRGGPAADRLRSDDGAVDGGGGNDDVTAAGTVRGGTGDDQLTVSREGHNDVDAGPGDDVIRATWKAGMDVHCGAGVDLVDTVASAKASRLDRSCERIVIGDETTMAVRPTLTRQDVGFAIRCSEQADRECRGRLHVHGLAATTAYRLAPGGQRVVRIALAGRRPVLERGRLRVSHRRTMEDDLQVWWAPPRAGRAR